MRLVAGIDFETTGLDPLTDQIIEVGGVLWDWDRQVPVMIVSGMCQPDKQIEEKITKITGITPVDLMQFSEPRMPLMARLENLLSKTQFLMAHNAPFDMAFRFKFIQQNTTGSKLDHTVIDSQRDIPFDEEKHQSKRLIHLAATHGFVNPFPHRAVFDVLTMLKVASQYPLEVLIERSKMPTVKVVAHVQFSEKDKAKDAGFHWESKDKIWCRDMKECDIKQGVWPFAVTVFKQ